MAQRKEHPGKPMHIHITHRTVKLLLVMCSIRWCKKIFSLPPEFMNTVRMEPVRLIQAIHTDVSVLQIGFRMGRHVFHSVVQDTIVREFLSITLVTLLQTPIWSWWRGAYAFHVQLHTPAAPFHKLQAVKMVFFYAMVTVIHVNLPKLSPVSVIVERDIICVMIHAENALMVSKAVLMYLAIAQQPMQLVVMPHGRWTLICVIKKKNYHV
jgi:hypothetical protein